MERTKKTDTVEPVDDGKIWWKKVGGGSFKLGKRYIKPGEKFRASEDEIPKGFRDLIIPLEELRGEAVEKKIALSKTEYEIRPRGKSKAYFDVVNKQSGKVINDEGLKKEIAEKLVNDLGK